MSSDNLAIRSSLVMCRGYTYTLVFFMFIMMLSCFICPLLASDRVARSAIGLTRCAKFRDEVVLVVDQVTL